jgi:tetratricopeptide (TPR) repeat protein
MGGFQIPPMPPALVEALKRSTMANAAPGGAIPPAAAPLNARPGVTLPSGQAPGPLPMSSPQPAAAPIRMGPGGTNLDPQPPGVNAMGVPSAPAPTGAKLPPITDDPAVAGPSNGMGAVPKPIDLGSYLNPALKQYQSDLSGFHQADEAHRVDPQQVKPHWWQYLAALGLGATQLKDPANAANIASGIVNGRREGAEQGRATALAPWTQRLQMDKEGMPLATAAADVADKQARLNLDTAKEERERYTAISNSDYKDTIANIRDEIAKGNIEKAQNQLDQQQKVLEEKAERDKDYFKMQHALLDLREKIAEKGNKAKPGQSVAIEAKKATALAKAKTTYDRETELAGNDPEARKTADDNFKQAQQDAQDAYENEINASGGDATHQDVASWRGKPASTSTASTAAPAGNTKPANDTASAAPTTMGPKGETPVKTASDGKAKIGFYKSTGQWMLVPQASTSGGK